MTAPEALLSLRAAVAERTIQRLRQTYADFLDNKPGFEQIPAFFRDHLYFPPDKAGRDASLEELYSRLRAVVGADMTQNIQKLIELIHISDDLDTATASQLSLRPGMSASCITETLSSEDFDMAVAMAAPIEDRARQVSLIQETLSFFFTLARLPFARLVLAPVRIAASLIGAAPLIQTMEQGYEIARKIDDIWPFLTAFVERETLYLDHLRTLQNRNAAGIRPPPNPI